jgi:hypothetical protein
MSKQQGGMRKHRPDLRTVENLRDFVEAIEIVRDFLIANTPQKVRLALIVLDNIAELLMAHICRDIFDNDEFVAKIKRPRFSRKFKENTLWYFRPKTELIKAEGLVTEGEAALLELGHSYRNPAFHQGRHNPRAVRALSIMLLQPIASLLQKAFSGVEEGGIGDIAWLRGYRVSTTALAFGGAVAKIMVQLTHDLREPLDRIKEALSEDIMTRLDRLDRSLNDEWYALSSEQWDDVLRHAQFVEIFDDEGASAEYREFVYRITDRTKSMTVDEIYQLPPNDPVSREEFARAKAGYDARYTMALSTFQPTFRISELIDLREEVARLNEAGSEATLIMAYRELDQRLTVAEDLFLAAQAIVDASIQHADLERGK